MAARNVKTVGFEREELDDSISCCICTNIYAEPKALPCIHTFCMNCLQEIGLKKNKGPGDEMPCPICRQEFKIPQEGFSGLPNNFFIAKLIQVANVSDSVASSRALCDACAEEIKEDNEERGKEISKAELYCNDCKQMLCDECSRHHRKLKLTKKHNMIPLNDLQVGDENAKANLALSVCELHEQRVLEIYCADCKAVECAVCFIDGHKHHEGSHVSKVVDGFLKQIESGIETINQCSFQTAMIKARLIKAKGDMQKKVEKLECAVMNRRDALREFVDAQANSLLQSLSSLRQSKSKELQVAAEEIDAHLSCLQSYCSYGQMITALGSASDICRAASDLSVTAIDLQQRCQVLSEKEIQVFKFCFTKLELEELLADCNFIGKIEEETISDQNDRFSCNLRAIEDSSCEANLLKNETKDEKGEKESYQFQNEQFQNSLDKKTDAQNIFKEQLNRESTNYSAKQNQLKFEQYNDKMTCRTVQANTEESLQELLKALDFEKTKILTLKVDKEKLMEELMSERAEAKKLRLELSSKKTLNKTFHIKAMKLRRQLDRAETRDEILHVNNKKLKQRLESERIKVENLLKSEDQEREDQGYEDWGMPESDFRARILDLEETLERERNAWMEEKEQLNKQIKQQQIVIGELRYRFDPVLVKQIRSHVTNRKTYAINGLTILDKELFVVSGNSSEVEVYDSTKFRFSRKWRIKESLNPMDITSCSRNKCLYIFSSKGHYLSHKILRVDPYGVVIKKWPTEDGGGLSVTDESNVILTGFSSNKIMEYSPNGKLIHEVYLSPYEGFLHPLHVIKLANGHFVVSHGYADDKLHRVCIVDADGYLKKSFGGESGCSSGQVHCPFHIAIDRSGFVMVADRTNSRVLLLDSDLKFKKEILLSAKHGLKDPWRILLDDTSGRLLLLDRGWETWDSMKEIIYSREILIYEFK